MERNNIIQNQYDLHQIKIGMSKMADLNSKKKLLINKRRTVNDIKLIFNR